MTRFDVGHALRPLTKEPFTREQLADYAKASGDENPIHLSDAEAKAAGLPSVIVHGMISMAYIADHVRYNFPEEQYEVMKMKTRFRKVTFPGDTLTCEGVIKKVLEPGHYQVELTAKNQLGETTAEGEAIVRQL